MLKLLMTYKINNIFKILGITLLVSLFFVAPIVYAFSTYTDLLDEDCVRRVLTTSMQEEEEEEDEIVDLDETKYLDSELMINQFFTIEIFNKEIKRIELSLFDPDLFIPPPKFIIS